MRWATIVTTYLSVCTCMSVSKWVCMCLRGIYGCPSSFIHSFGSCEAFEATNSIRIRSNTCTTVHKSVHTSTHGTPSDKRIPCPTNEYTCHWRVCYELRACVCEYFGCRSKAKTFKSHTYFQWFLHLFSSLSCHLRFHFTIISELFSVFFLLLSPPLDVSLSLHTHSLILHTLSSFFISF